MDDSYEMQTFYSLSLRIIRKFHFFLCACHSKCTTTDSPLPINRHNLTWCCKTTNSHRQRDNSTKQHLITKLWLIFSFPRESPYAVKDEIFFYLVFPCTPNFLLSVSISHCIKNVGWKPLEGLWQASFFDAENPHSWLGERKYEFWRAIGEFQPKQVGISKAHSLPIEKKTSHSPISLAWPSTS